LCKLPKNAAQKYATWLESRPRAAENEAIALVLRLGEEYGALIHIVHLSSTDVISLLQRVKSKGGRVSVETCPHYLTFAAEEIADSATEFKCAPPIRERENREKLWAALGNGTIDLVATDHSPCPPKMKLREEGDFLRAWGGIASLQVSLPAVWTQARSRGYSPSHIAKWMCSAPAKLAGLEKQKGLIAIGCDADFVMWNPEASFRVDAECLEHRHKLTPYAGRELFGLVAATFLRGKKIFEHGEFCGTTEGQVLVRGKE
jgi:allantoinase